MMPTNESLAPDPAVVTVRIRVARRAAEATEEFLWTLDPDAVSQVVAGDEVELTVTVSAMAAEGLAPRTTAFLREVGLDAAVTMETAAYQEEDWTNAYRQDFAPIQVSHRLVVASTWWDAPLPPARVTLRIDPQMAFGTGHHPTTLACLEWLVRRADASESDAGGVIDAGCGSGLLAIAAHHLGFAPVIGVDNDPIACTTARQNAIANAAGSITVLDGDLNNAALPYVPTLVANLTAGSIVRLFPRLAAHVTPGGQIYLAGILTDQEDMITAAIGDHKCQVVERRVTEGWLGLAVQRT
jgi:ribosomal protein L11 methyltransferase